jgi:hypothetical protein
MQGLSERLRHAAVKEQSLLLVIPAKAGIHLGGERWKAVAIEAAPVKHQITV